VSVESAFVNWRPAVKLLGLLNPAGRLCILSLFDPVYSIEK